jgi:hypothetical protein
LVLNQAPGKTGKSPVFPLNSRKLFQKLKFWNSLDYLANDWEIYTQSRELDPQNRI